tara:strand:- start:381 stop:845 length:465 start_codon:yes stop_codon:yes gene_type:complete
MKIKKNGKVINLTESDLKLIVKRVLTEETEENVSSDPDYDTASNFAKNVENWWGGSSDLTNWDSDLYKGYHQFFSKFQGSIDSDKAAAIAYKNHIMNELDSKVGPSNSYYKKLKSWIDEIVDQIDDYFQNECWVHLNSKDGRSGSYKVDPEIDV